MKLLLIAMLLMPTAIFADITVPEESIQQAGVAYGKIIALDSEEIAKNDAIISKNQGEIAYLNGEITALQEKNVALQAEIDSLNAAINQYAQ